MCCSHTCQFSVIAALSPPLPLPSFPFTFPSSPSSPPSPSSPSSPSPPLSPITALPLPSASPPSIFFFYCLPIQSPCICTSLIISPPIPPYVLLYIGLSLTHFHSCILNMGR